MPIFLQTDPALLPSMDDLLGKHVDLRTVRKIGEGERTAVGRVWACWSQQDACIAPQRQLYAKMNAPLISAASQAHLTTSIYSLPNHLWLGLQGGRRGAGYCAMRR